MGLPGRLIPAYLADRYFGALAVFVPTIFLTGLCVFLWATVSSVTGEFIWVAFFGLFGGGVQSLFPTALAGLTKDLSKRGTRIGMVFSIVSVACLTGPPLAGKLVDASDGKYIGAQVWGGSCLVLGAGILSAAWLASRAVE
jgi:peptide chain release factor 1